MASGGNLRKKALLTGKARVQGVTGDQTVKATPGNLWRVQAVNADVGAQTLALKDGTTVLNVIRLPPGASAAFPLGFECATSIVVTPSSANVGALVMFD